MQRALADLSGLRSTDSDTRPWLRHAAWPRSYRPLIDPPPLPPTAEPVIDAYEFVRVEGDGVHEIAVGPVHAGIIEPGHFRFSVVGEKVLRLEERLGYVHKGIERRFTAATHPRRPSAGRARVGGFGRRVLLGVLPGARGHRGRADSAARRVAARAVPRARTRRQSPGGLGRTRQRCGLRLWSRRSSRV